MAAAIAPTRKFPVIALAGTVVHGGIIIALLAILIVQVPNAKKMFDEFGLTLPWATQALVKLSLWADERLVLLLALLPLFLGIDFLIAWALGRARRPHQLGWLIAITVGLLLIVGAAELSVEMPLMKLREGLSR